MSASDVSSIRPGGTRGRSGDRTHSRKASSITLDLRPGHAPGCAAQSVWRGRRGPPPFPISRYLLAPPIMRMLVLGRGLQGSACAYDLLQHPDVTEVRLADLHVDHLPPFLAPYSGQALIPTRLDVRDARRVQAPSCANATP